MPETGAIPAIEALIERGDDIWEVLVNAGIQAQEFLDTGRWTIGDLAGLVDKQYGQNTIGTFAKAINVEVERVREYRTVAAFWEIPHRQKIRADYPTITYSHMREAMRLKSVEAAEAFIEECAGEGWTVEEARLKLRERLGKPLPPRKLVDGVYVPVAAGQSLLGFEFEPAVARTLRRCWYDEQAVRVVIYAPEEEVRHE